MDSKLTNYLYDNDLKIQTVESSDKETKNIMGFWSFLYNSKFKGYISQIHYHIFRKKKSLHVNLKDIKDLKNNRISCIILLYFLSIYIDSYDIDKITIKHHNVIIDDDDKDIENDNNYKNDNNDKECFLCKNYDNNCVICQCEKDGICPISKIIESYSFNKRYEDKYILSFRELKNIMFLKDDNSISHIRNHFNKKLYSINSQEHIEYINCINNTYNIDINGYISIENEKYDNNIYFNFTQNKNTKYRLNIIINENIQGIQVIQDIEDIKMMILHLVSSYSKNYKNISISISFHEKHKELCNFFLNSGFILSFDNSKKRDFFGLEIDIPICTLINYISI